MFVVGLLALALTGMNGAQDFGVDTAPLLSALGPVAGPAGAATDMWGGLLGQLGGMIAGAQGGDPETPTAVSTYGPDAIVGLVSALVMFFSTRR